MYTIQIRSCHLQVMKQRLKTSSRDRFLLQGGSPFGSSGILTTGSYLWRGIGGLVVSVFNYGPTGRQFESAWPP